MKRSAVVFSPVLRQAYRALAVVVALLVLWGLTAANTGEERLAYLLLVSAAVLPTVLWIRAGASGIPVLPTVALMHIAYFAVPVVKGNAAIQEYEPWEILRASATVSLLLVAAAAPWWLLTRQARASHSVALGAATERQLIRLMFLGLAVGVVFHVAVISGWLGWLGSFFGLVRSVALTFTTVACYLLGIGRAGGVLRGKAWAVAVAGLLIIMLLNWSSLFLVGGVMFVLAAALGYTISAKRVSWLAVAVAVIVVTVLHAGKAEMRENYWEGGTNFGGINSVTQVPKLFGEWVGEGSGALFSGAGGQDIVDRVSLLHMLLLVQRLTPDYIEFLEGESYALLPAMLVPRFLAPDKIASQAGMELLNIRYGIQTAEDASVTAIGWGLIPEAYANFGYLGVVGVALAMGAFAGALTRWSAGASVVSLPVLSTIAAMMNLINMEPDLAYLLTNLWQSFAAVLIFFGMFRLVVRRETNRRGPRAFAAPLLRGGD